MPRLETPRLETGTRVTVAFGHCRLYDRDFCFHEIRLFAKFYVKLILYEVFVGLTNLGSISSKNFFKNE